MSEGRGRPTVQAGPGAPDARSGSEELLLEEREAREVHTGSELPAPDRPAGPEPQLEPAEAPDASDVRVAPDVPDALEAHHEAPDALEAQDAPEALPGATPTRPTPGRPRGTGGRRTAADPVKALMHRHRELCEQAVDPLEIAAGLEAHGVTDRTATRFRHRDVFSLAEEMYARASRDEDTPRPAALAVPRPRLDWVLLTLLPGALCAATVAGLHLTHGRSRLITAAVGTLAVTLALRAALSRGPLAAPARAARTNGTRICWLLAYALLGDGLLAAALTGGPDTLPTGTADSTWPLATAPVLALALACAPAAWAAHLLSATARRKLAASRGLDDFASSVRPLLLGVFALFLCALTTFLALCATALSEPAAPAQALTLGALLFLARLLRVHGSTRAPALVLTTTATAEITALATTFAARLPGLGSLAVPVDTVVDTWGVGAVPALACGAGALALLVHATRRLTTASAHASAPGTTTPQKETTP